MHVQFTGDSPISQPSLNLDWAPRQKRRLDHELGVALTQPGNPFVEIADDPATPRDAPVDAAPVTETPAEAVAEPTPADQTEPAHDPGVEA